MFGFAPMSRHDGPGLRTVVYFQGCSVGCAWCHSPHSQPFEGAPLLYRPDNCLGCRRCETVCPDGVHRFEAEGHVLDRSNCGRCGRCIKACPQSSANKEAGVLFLPTKTMSVGALFTRIEPALEVSGRLTLSGGEALQQPAAAAKLLSLSRAQGIHTAVETSGLLDARLYETVLNQVDLWLLGLRVVTEADLADLCGRVKAAVKLLQRASGGRILPMIPAVPGVMDTPVVLRRVAEILKIIENDGEPFDILINPWNNCYDLFYQHSGLPLKFPRPEAEAVRRCQKILIDALSRLGRVRVNA